jgi:hypothetical protein
LQVLPNCDLLETASNAVSIDPFHRSAIVNSKPFSLKALSLAVLLCCTAAAAQADVLVFTDRTAFLAAVQAPGIDTFNDLSISPFPSPLMRTAGAYSYQASTLIGDFYPGGSAADIWLTTDSATDTTTFSGFSAGVQAFGGYFFGSDITGAFSPGRTMVLTATDGTISRTVNLANTTTSTFLGFVSTTPLTSVSLRGEGVPGIVYWATANNVILAAVPEPATYGMLLGGLALLGFAARRRRGS